MTTRILPQPATCPTCTHKDRKCAICGQPADVLVLILDKLTCRACFDAATDDAVRLYRRSLAVVKGGLPG